MDYRRHHIGLALLIVGHAGCAHTLERRGDARMAQGDPAGAVRSWELAIREPLMDFELERIQEKRRVALGGIYGARIEALRARRAGMPLVLSLVELRAEARDSAAAVLARFDEVLAEELAKGALTLPPGGDPATHLAALVGLRRDMANLACPDDILAQVEAAAVETLPRVALGGSGPVEPRLAALFSARIALREGRFSASTMGRFDAAIAALGRQPIEALSSEEEARGRLERWLAIDAGAFREALDPSARAIAAGVVAHAAEALVPYAREAYEAGDLARALEITELSLRGVPRAHPARGWYAELRAGAADVALDRAAALGEDREALELVHRGVARHLGASEPGFEEARRAAAPLHVFRPVLRLKSRGEGCEPLHEAFPLRFESGEVVEVQADVRCVDSRAERREVRTARYRSEHVVKREREFQERVRVTKYRTVKRQCSRPSALEGYRWEGVCEHREPYTDYETRTVTRLVDVVEPFEGQLDYQALVVTRRSGMQGRFVVTTAKGERFVVPVNELVDDSEVAFDYVLPPETLSGPPRPQRRQIPESFTLEAARAEAARRVAEAFYRDLEAAAQAHRAEAALARGRAAEAAADLDLAGHEYARAALHAGRVDPSTEPLFRRAFGLDAALVGEALFGEGARPDVPSDAEARGPTPPAPQPHPPAPEPPMWADTAQIESKGFDRIFRGHESGHFRARAFDHFLPSLPPMAGGRGAGDRHAPMIGISYHVGALQYLVNGDSGWGFRLHDEVELGAAGGLSVTRKAQGEGRGAYMLNARYLLGAGVRTHWFSVFAGMRVGANYLRTGAVRSAAFHLDPFARLAIRTAGPSQIVLYVSGLQLVDGMQRVDTAVLRVPAFGRKQYDLVFTAERFQSRTRAPGGGEGGGSNMGTRSTYLFGAGIGIVW